MKTRKLGPHLTVSTVGLGCMGMSHAYGGQDEQDARRFAKMPLSHHIISSRQFIALLVT